MSKVINVRIDVDKIDKSKIYVGEKGRYLDITVAELREPGKYEQTHSVYIQQTKEERENKADRKYLGHGKEYEFKDKDPVFYNPETDEDLPF